MNKNFKTSDITEAAMISVILVLFNFISVFIFPFIMFIYPFPAIVIGKRRGFKYSVLSLVVAGLLSSILMGLEAGFSSFLLFGPIAITMSYCVSSNKNANKSMLYGGIAFIFSFIAILFILKFVLGIDIIEEVAVAMEQAYIMQSELFLAAGNATGNVDIANTQMDKIGQMYETSLLFFQSFLPLIIIFSGMAIAWINYFVVEKLSNRLSFSVRELISFKYISLPYSFIIAIAAFLVLSYGLGYLGLNAVLVQQNILMICMLCVLIQGISVVSYYLAEYNVTKIIRIFVYIMIFIMPFFSDLVSVAGMVDLIFDIRRLRR